MGTGDGTFVEIGGDSKPLVEAAANAEKALMQLSKAIRDMNKEAGDGGKTLGGAGKDGLDQYKFSMDSLSESVLKSMGSFGGFMVALNSTFGVISTIVGVIGGAVDGFLHFAETIGGAVVDAVRMASDEITHLTEQVFELNKSTEQTTGSWRFIYGGQTNAQDLMQWTSQFSMKVPYTRQDLLGAVTALGRAGFSEDQVKQYMQTIADMGALNPQRDLTGAAWSIQGAMHGYSRMLKYDYGISPDDLAKFGYDQSNPEMSLMPALRQYLQSRGLTGASKYAATQTFWGAESSLIDRIQNFGLQVGGTDLNGTISKGGMFGMLKTDLTDISKWIDDHGDQIKHLADLIGNVLGGAAQQATSAIKDMLQGLKDSNLYQWVLQVLDPNAVFGKNTTYRGPGSSGASHRGGRIVGETGNNDLISTPNTDPLTRASGSHGGEHLANEGDNAGKAGAQLKPQEQLSFWREIGAVIGAAAKDVGMFGDALVKAFMTSGAKESLTQGLQNIVSFLSNPEHQKQIMALGAAIGNGLGQAIKFAGDVANGLGNIWHWLTSHLDPETWLAIKLVLVAIGTIISIVVIVPLTLLMGLFAGIALVIGTVVGIVWLLIHAFEWLKNLDIGKLFSDVSTAISKWASGVVKDATDWGKHMMNNFVSAIIDGIPGLRGALSKVTDAFNPVKHSVPTEGPLKDDDKWMAHFVDNLVAPLHAGVPRIAAATRQIAGTMASELGSYGGYGSGGGAGGNSTSYASNSYGGHSSISQTFHGTSEAQMERVAKRVIAEADLAQNILARRSGGYRPGGFGSIG